MKWLQLTDRKLIQLGAHFFVWRFIWLEAILLVNRMWAPLIVPKNCTTMYLLHMGYFAACGKYLGNKLLGFCRKGAHIFCLKLCFKFHFTIFCLFKVIFFTDSTMVNHHEKPTFGDYVCIFFKPPFPVANLSNQQAPGSFWRSWCSKTNKYGWSTNPPP